MPLDYFDDYSKSRCIIECEMEAVQKKCECRVFYMPHKQGKAMPHKQGKAVPHKQSKAMPHKQGKTMPYKQGIAMPYK